MRVTLVTGAARGIGAATVRELCRQGYAVTALDVCSGGDVLPGVGYAMANRAQLDAGTRRLIAPEEIASTIALCCSPAGAALNGSAVRADGGFS